MSLSQNIVNHPANPMNGALLEKVIIQNDLSGLSPIEKVQYVKSICQTIGLNPVTKPIQLMKLSGKEIPYFTKDATEQLRKINKVSINKVETKMLDGGVYVVTAYAMMPDGRQDSSTGVISILGLKGDVLANAMMKAETKSKRRVTLSICGLGFIDECEVDSIPNAKKMDITQVEQKPEPVNTVIEDNGDIELQFSELLHDINNAMTLDELQTAFAKIKKVDFKNKQDLLKKLVNAKDEKKGELSVKEFNQEIDQSTGEII